MLNGLLIVLKYAFKRPITILYPEKKRKLPARSRGRHYLTKWEDGRSAVWAANCVPSSALHKPFM